jgi:para-nitrobenzyl esterase
MGVALAGGGLLLARQAGAAPSMFPIVETAQGKLRGLLSGGVAVFKGIRYAASSAGANRFMPPVSPPEWTGVRDALSYGETCPQVPADRRHDYADLIAMDLQPSGPGEDCLRVNVWTPSVDPQAKKPVIVVLHGGGFYGGSGNSTGMDGEMMARFSETVVVSVTHRLGAFGYLYLAGEAGGGQDFGESGSVGMQDIVAALRWVRENIAQFGGDANRVLVFGQSGGGAKTSMLLAMPSGKGLFQRAGVMSGSLLRGMDEETADLAAMRLLKALDLAKGDIRQLQQLPFSTLLTAQAAIEAEDRARGEAPMALAPVVGGTAIPAHPFDPKAPAVSHDVPMIISSVLDERTFRMVEFKLTEAELVAYAREKVGANADAVLQYYREETPAASPFILKARLDTDVTFRRGAFLQAERKAAAGGAPVWTYLWTWPSPASDGIYGAVHGIDVAPSLYNTRGALTGTDRASRTMAARLASCWASFAASGDPNNARVPTWAPYTPDKRATLLLDNETRVVDDPRAKVREWLKNVPYGGVF